MLSFYVTPADEVGRRDSLAPEIAVPRWQARTASGWRDCMINDLSWGMRKPGMIEVHVPADAGKWNGATLDPEQQFNWLRVVWDGAPNQRFHALRTPITGDAMLQVREPDASTEAWRPWLHVEDFSASNPHASHYTLDRLTGLIRFGDGKHGRIPPPGANNIRLRAYHTGGGSRGNRLSENLIYRLGRVTPASKLQFLRLLKGAQWDGWNALAEADIEQAIKRTVREMAHSECAVTAADFERLARQAATAWLGTEQPIRVLCVASIDLEHPHAAANPAHVSVVLASDAEPAAALREAVKQDLLPRCLLTTRLHVVAPITLYIAIGFKLATAPGQSMAQLRRALREVLQQRFGPGMQGDGWPFGRSLHLPDLIEAIDQIPGVDYVEELHVRQIGNQEDSLATQASALGLQLGIHSTVGVDTLLGSDRLLRNAAGRLVSILLKPWELLRVTVADADIEPARAQ